MLYIAKQPLLIPYSEAHVVKFERVAGVLGSSRTFDLRVVLRSGEENVFSSLGKDEHSHIFEYLQDRKVSVKNEMHDEMIATQSAIVRPGPFPPASLLTCAHTDRSPQGGRQHR